MTDQMRYTSTWKRIDPVKTARVVLVILTCSFVSFFLTARSAEAKKNTEATFQYYTQIIVQEGDSLWSIAEEMMQNEATGDAYSDPRAYIEEILTLNQIADMDHIRAGRELIIPYYSTAYQD